MTLPSWVSRDEAVLWHGFAHSTPQDVRRLADACRSTGTLLICDEVATGFGRTGVLFASAHCGVSPGLLRLGKGLVDVIAFSLREVCR
jgi:adenosylmethionine-8-amino-7-oxononanoate aminotransferase